MTETRTGEIMKQVEFHKNSIALTSCGHHFQLRKRGSLGVHYVHMFYAWFMYTDMHFLWGWEILLSIFNNPRGVP
jgi:hypothetical protein